ncbi:MAG: hypothetical protein ACREJD_16750 [Phycisphaerales bacterium]
MSDQSQQASIFARPEIWSALGAIISAVMAFVTWRTVKRYTDYTKILTDETQAMRRGQSEPIVIAAVVPGKELSLDLIVRNVGRGAAFRVKLIPSQFLQLAFVNAAGRPLESGMMKNGISLLLPEQELRLALGEWSKLESELRGPNLAIDVEYDVLPDPQSERRADRYPVEVSHLDRVSLATFSSPAEKSADAMRDLASTIKNIGYRTAHR